MAMRRRDLFGLGSLGGAIGLLGGLTWPRAKRERRAQTPMLRHCRCSTSIAPAIHRAPGRAWVIRRSSRPRPISRPAVAMPCIRRRRGRRAPPSGLRKFDLSVDRDDARDCRWAKPSRHGRTVEPCPARIVRATVGDRFRVTLGQSHQVRPTASFSRRSRCLAGRTRTRRERRRPHLRIRGRAGGTAPLSLPRAALCAACAQRHVWSAMIVDPLRAAARRTRISPVSLRLRRRRRRTQRCLCLERHGRILRAFSAQSAGGRSRSHLSDEHGRARPDRSFHLHAQTFDLFRSGTSLSPHEHTDIVSLGPAERAILEFRLPRRGRYMFHPHQSRMAERGAMGWIVAI